MHLAKNLILAFSLSALMTSCDKVKTIVDEVTGNDKPKERVVGRSHIVSSGRETLDKWKAEPNVFVVVDFYSDTCEPCRVLEASLKEMASKYGDKSVILKVNIDRNSALAEEYGVSGTPDVRCYLNGKEVDKFVGTKPDDQLDKIFAKHTKEIDDDLPILEREVETEPSGPITVQREKGYLPPGVERAKIPKDMKGQMQISSPGKKGSTEPKPIIDLGPAPQEDEPEKSE